MPQHDKQPRFSILCVSPNPDDPGVLARIVQPYGWRVHWASTVAGAMELLRNETISVLICERDLTPQSWKDLLAEVVTLSRPPLVIIASRHADDYLWAEALNLGAHDVLSKPFDSPEVTRTLSSAALNWWWKHEPAVRLLATSAGA